MRSSLWSTLLAVFISTVLANCQVLPQTAEDSLSSSSGLESTSIGGYGNAFYQRNSNLSSATMNLERVVLFVGHSFGKISFFSELELEDAKVSGNDDGGEIAFEQAYLQFNLDRNHYITAGLFLPRIGITNEKHLPIDFNGNERSQVETYIIPATWRELGVGFYGSVSGIPLNYGVALVNGLNSASFEHGSGIREGRSEGKNASASNLAITGSVQYFRNNFRIQASGYYGGSVGLSSRQADSLQLQSGPFGIPVIIGEVNVQYATAGFTLKALGAVVSIPHAFEINRAYATNTPEREYGVYAELGYDVLHETGTSSEQQLIVFARYERLDMNALIPSNGIIDGTLNQQHVVAGVGYLPIRNVVVKADVRLLHTGEANQALIINPNPAAPRYDPNNIFISLGIGFAF
jgi:hypothetical protein